MENIETITINDTQYVKLSEVQTVEQVEGEFLTIGKKYFVRTLSYHYVGVLKGLNDNSMVLGDASWVADSGRFNQALANGTLSEVERYPGDVILNRNVVVDSSICSHSLPKESK